MKDNVVFSDYMADVKENWSKIIDGFESSDILDFKVSDVNPRRGRYATTEESREDLKQLSNAIAEMLTKRLAAIRVSNLSE
ncbi:hypothetical protein [Sharpea azabuensis]|uniref:hypothetical protein n=1 Tax=Sharpea azabuensis TaxID=322505 RepID=UPI001569B059|nr:hypothetical protein [Sharpea azabuensis]